MRRVFLGIFLAALLAAAAGLAHAAESKVIIIGFDGMDIRLVEKYMAEGLMPNFQKISQQGQLSRLQTTNPAESPVAWAAFSIGANPGKTGIFDFLRRMPGSYYPEFATVSPSTQPLFPSSVLRGAVAAGLGLVAFLLFFFLVRIISKSLAARLAVAILFAGIVGALASVALFKWLPRELPVPVSNRLGESFWKLAGQAGVPSACIRIPVDFPAEDFQNGVLLSGLGVPDIRQTNGTFTVYSTRKASVTDTEMGGKIVQISVMGDRIEDDVLGPKNFLLPDKPDVMAPFTAKINRAEKTVDITVQGKTQKVALGEYSDFFVFDFKLNPLISLQGIAKFALLSLEPDVRIYLAPINFSPLHLPATVRISTPASFAPSLAKRLGLFKTLGWQEETWALNEGQISEELFLDDLFKSMDDIEKIMLSELEKRESRLFVGVFESTDRMQHMFWRFIDPTHPLYNAEEAKKYERAVAKLYQKCDRFLGEVADKYVDPSTTLMVMSDHGFESFRKAVNINTWLVENGFMALKGQEKVRDRNLDDLFGHGEFWPNVDWSRTKAYHIGLGNLYINLFEREPQGAVLKSEYEALQNEIIDKLRALRDPEDGRPVLLNAYRRQDIYHGPALANAPDIILGFNSGYRISWQSSLGGIPKGVVVPNDRKWSGDHCSIDPSIMAGIFLSNRKTPAAPRIIDIAPSALKILGVPVSPAMDGLPLY